MKMKKFGATEQLVFELAKPIADECGSRIWDVRFEKEGASWYLRVFIDREEGVTIDDCEAVSRPLSDILDEKDPISQGYFLEVGSAGLERELIREAHFEASLGEFVTVKLFKAIEGVKEFTAKLAGFDKEKLTLAFPLDENEDNSKEILLADIAAVRLYEDFDKLF